MKTCLTCIHKSELDVSTCPYCGEASWDDDEQDETPTNPETPKSKRPAKK